MNAIEHTLFAILRTAIDSKKVTYAVDLTPPQWKLLFRLALRQQVGALVYDALQGTEHNMPDSVRQSWRQYHLFSTQRFDAQLLTMTSLSAQLEAEGIRMLLLKGIGVALAYPTPQLRECVDIDIYCFADYDRVNQWVVSSGIDKEVVSHCVGECCFQMNGIEVENHCLFTTCCNAATSSLNRALMRMSEQMDPMEDPRLPGVLLPSPSMGALHLLSHALSHLAWSGITLRFLCDITLYLQAHMGEIDFALLRHCLNDAGVEKSACLLLDLCNRYLELGMDLSDWAHYERKEATVVLERILHPYNESKLTRNPFKKFFRKEVIHRFRSQLHQIVYATPYPNHFLDSFACLQRIENENNQE